MTFFSLIVIVFGSFLGLWATQPLSPGVPGSLSRHVSEAGPVIGWSGSGTFV